MSFFCTKLCEGRRRERERGGQKETKQERRKNICHRGRLAREEGNGREIGDISGRKCTLVKEWMFEHCMTEI